MASLPKAGLSNVRRAFLETNVPGIFVVGDVRKGSVKRVASGVGEGSIAIQFVHQYLGSAEMLTTGLLRQNPVFQDLPENELQWLVDQGEDLNLEPDQILFQ